MRFKTIVVAGLLIAVAITCHKRNNPNQGINDPGEGPQAPLALFSVTPDTVELNELVFVDATTCSDVEDSVDILRVRWDWETDAIWDTPYKLAKIGSTSYSTPGLKYITLEVKDTDNMADTLELPVWVNAPNTAPTACFSVDPDTGDETTVFSFNAGCSDDAEDTLTALSFRWDWDSDGTWDTTWTTSTVVTHQFATTGIKTITLQVRDSDGDTARTSSQLNVGGSNTSPNACFSISQATGTINTIFQVSAACSDDSQEPPESLEVRWDWDGDGNWDTGYSKNKTATHSYTTVGTKTIKAQVKDSEGLYAITEKQVTVNNTAPVASFTVSPALGTVDTLFRVNAGACSDSEDVAGVLEVRWDWEDDGTWDIGWNTTKTNSHTYTSTGGKTIRMEVRDQKGAVTAMTRSVNVVASGNTPPVASFTVDADSGDTSTSFGFDASGCSDNEDAKAVLQVRWDWENNGIFDVEWTTVKTVAHTYSTAGTYMVKMEVRDSDSLVSSDTVQVVVIALDSEYMTDSRDGKRYKIVTIGTQTWMAENLNVGQRINGSLEQTDNSVIEKYGYNDDDTIVDSLGGLYEWNEAMQYSTTPGVQGICPDGWHLPTDNEWKALEMSLGMLQNTADIEGLRGDDEGVQLKVGGNSEFEAYMTGYRRSNGLFGGWNNYTDFWSSSDYDSNYAWRRVLKAVDNGITRTPGEKIGGYCVRCIRGQGATPVINTKPTAVFTLASDSIDVNSNFSVDASGCSDTEDSPSELEVSWQWTAGGSWTTFSTTKTAGNVYTAAGQYTISMIVRDTDGLTDTVSHAVTVIEPVVGTLYDDRDGKTYATVVIGGQTWMAENLNYGQRVDGVTQQKNNGVVEKYAFDNLESNASNYGALYQWHEAMNYSMTPGVQGICPNGWYLPTDEDWKDLERNLGMLEVDVNSTNRRGVSEGDDLKSGGETGFNSLIAGYRYSDGSFVNFDVTTRYWSSSIYDSSVNAWYRLLEKSTSQISRNYNDAAYGFCVRCVKGQGAVPNDVMVDPRDNRVYKTVIIGSQTWMAENLNYGVYIQSNNTGSWHTEATDNGVCEKYAYNNDTTYFEDYGGLYDWKEAMGYSTIEGAQGICPNGWHIPTDDELKVLEMNLGMSQNQADSLGWRGINQGTQLNIGGESGFDATISGYRYSGGTFDKMDDIAYMWSSSEADSINAWHRRLAPSSEQVFREKYYKTSGFCVRCIRD